MGGQIIRYSKPFCSLLPDPLVGEALPGQGPGLDEGQVRLSHLFLCLRRRRGEKGKEERATEPTADKLKPSSSPHLSGKTMSDHPLGVPIQSRGNDVYQRAARKRPSRGGRAGHWKVSSHRPRAPQGKSKQFHRTCRCFKDTTGTVYPPRQNLQMSACCCPLQSG